MVTRFLGFYGTRRINYITSYITPHVVGINDKWKAGSFLLCKAIPTRLTLQSNFHERKDRNSKQHPYEFGSSDWKYWSVHINHLDRKARLHQALASILQQLCNGASDTALIENNEVAPESGCNPFSSDTIVFNENSFASIITELSQRWRLRWV